MFSIYEEKEFEEGRAAALSIVLEPRDMADFFFAYMQWARQQTGDPTPGDFGLSLVKSGVFRLVGERVTAESANIGPNSRLFSEIRQENREKEENQLEIEQNEQNSPIFPQKAPKRAISAMNEWLGNYIDMSPEKWTESDWDELAEVFEDLSSEHEAW